MKPTLLSFNNKLISTSNRFSKNTIKMIENPIPGVELGIPLSIFQNIFTNLHYGKDITSINSLFLQFCIGYFTYGSDRYLDSLDETELNNNNERKIKLYNTINKNKELILSLLVLSYTYIIYSLSLNQETVPFIFLLLSTFKYKTFKKNFGEFKAIYIAILWVISSVIIPGIIYDHNYSIIFSPEDYVPGILTLFASSNYADSFDYNEDKENNIKTLPVLLGVDNSNKINLIALLLSSIIFGFNDNFQNRPIVNNLFEFQNLGLFSTILINNSSNSN